MNLGVSEKHSTHVGLILNLVTGSVSPQFHCVYDDLFTTVPNAEYGGILDEQSFDLPKWNRVIQSGHDLTVEQEWDANGRPIPLPELNDEWLSAHERELCSQLQRERRANRQQGQQDWQDHRQRELLHEHEPPDPLPPPQPLPDPEREEQVIFNDPGLDQEDDGDDDQRDDDPQIRHSQRTARPPNRLIEGNTARRFKNENLAQYHCGREPKQKIRSGLLNEQYLQTLNWERATDTLKGGNLGAMLSQMEMQTDQATGETDEMHPMILAAKANSYDNPTWTDAMNGPNKEGYWRACETEVRTLTELKDAWEVVDRETWMNVLPSVWAFKCKRFPNGLVRKLKARFCAEGMILNPTSDDSMKVDCYVDADFASLWGVEDKQDP